MKRPVKLDANELRTQQLAEREASGSRFDELLEDLLKQPELARYPQREEELKQALAEYTGWQANGIMLANGSDELIQALTLAWAGRQQGAVVTFEPTFAVYDHAAQWARIDHLPLPLTSDFRVDLERFRQQTESYRQDGAPGVMTWLCRPNNPTGNLEPLAVVEELAQLSGWLVVDEAYFEFCGQTVVDLLDQPGFENVIVTRTFSKAFGLAGIRLGYMLAAPALVEEVRSYTMLYNTSVVSQGLGILALRHLDGLPDVVDEVCRERDWLLGQLRGCESLEPFDSMTNFILCRCQGFDPLDLSEYLAGQSIQVRAYPGNRWLKEMVRVSVGTRQENEELVRAIRQFERGR